EQPRSQAQTPSRRTRPLLAEDGTPRSILKKSGIVHAVNGANGTPRSTRKLLFETPTKTAKDETPNGTPTIVRNADRSARRKTNRRILERTLNGMESDEEALDDEDALAEQILAEQEEGEEEVATAKGLEEAAPEPVSVPETPSKRGRGRPK